MDVRYACVTVTVAANIAAADTAAVVVVVVVVVDTGSRSGGVK